MKRLLCLLATTLALSTCSGGDGDFKDSLTFGTGVDGTGMALAGEATSFTARGGSAALWFRLSSSANFSGRFVRLYLNKLEQKDFAGCANPDAHQCLSQLSLNPGSYEVKGYLVKTNLDIGEETLVATATLSVQ